jgi:hypothetical protein
VLGGMGGREARLGRCVRGGEPRRAFYRREEVGSGEIFPAGRSPAELERLLDARPDFAASGDETARAAAGQLAQVKGQLGAACAVVEQGRRGGLRWWR